MLNILLSSQPLDLSLLHFPSLSVTYLVLSFLLHCFCCYWDVLFTRYHNQDQSMQVKLEKIIVALVTVTSQEEVTSVLSPLPLDNEHKRYLKKYNWALHGKLGVCNGYVCWHQNRIPEKNKVVLYDNYKFIQKNVIHWVCAHMVQFIWDSSRT